MATTITYACSVCSKSFGENHKACAQYVKASKGQCRPAGAVVQRVPIFVGIHDRNVGGRVAANQDGLGSESDSDASDPKPNASVEGDSGGGAAKEDTGAPLAAAGESGTYPSTHIHSHPCTYPELPMSSG
jgi:hypothetical protein